MNDIEQVGKVTMIQLNIGYGQKKFEKRNFYFPQSLWRYPLITLVTLTSYDSLCYVPDFLFGISSDLIYFKELISFWWVSITFLSPSNIGQGSRPKLGCGCHCFPLSNTIRYAIYIFTSVSSGTFASVVWQCAYKSTSSSIFTWATSAGTIYILNLAHCTQETYKQTYNNYILIF